MEKGSRHLPAEERRAEVVNAVIGLAAEQDPCSITTAAIAARLDLTQGAIFRHFPDKATIWEAVMGWVAEQLLTKIGRAAQNAPSALAALEAVFLTHIDFIAAHPGVPRILSSELQRAEDTAAKLKVRILLEKYAHLLKKLLQTGKQQGELMPELDISSAVSAFIGIIQWMAAQSLLTEESQWLHQAAPKVLAIYRRGIEAAAIELAEVRCALELQYEAGVSMGAFKRDSKTQSDTCFCPAKGISDRPLRGKLKKILKLSLLILLIMPDKDTGKFLQRCLPSGDPIATTRINNVLSGSNAAQQTPVDLILGVPHMAGLDWCMLAELSRLDADATMISVLPAAGESINLCDLILDCPAELQFFLDTLRYLLTPKNS